MQHFPFLDSLINHAMLGSGKKALDVSGCPKSLQAAIAQIREQHLDADAEFLQIASLLFLHEQSSFGVKRNSFSLEEIAVYYDAVSTFNTSTNTRSNTSNPNALSGACVQDLKARIKNTEEPVPLPAWSTPNQGSATPNMHNTRPVGTGVSGVKVTEFSQEVTQLLQRACDDQTHGMLYYLLRRLSVYPLHVASDTLPLLLKQYKSQIFTDFRVGFEQPLFSKYMLQELLLKVGGDPLRYILYVQSPTRTIAALIEELHQQELEKYFSSQAPSAADAVNPTELAHTKQATPVTSQDASADAGNSGQSSQSKFAQSDFGVDYTRLVTMAPFKTALEILVKLRWTQPALARELIRQKMLKVVKNPEQVQLVDLFNINLSLDDEPFLMQLLQDTPSLSLRQTVAELLGDMGSPQYSKQCLAVCSKYLKFNGTNHHGQPWQLELDQFKYGPEFEALGISNNILRADAGREFSIKWLISSLLKRMTWDDLCVLAKAENSAQALDHFAIFEESVLAENPPVPIPKATDFALMAILGKRIALKQDPELSKAFLQKVEVDLAGKFKLTYQTHLQSVIDENIMATLPEDLRIERVPNVKESMVPCSWLAGPRVSYYELRALSPQWSQAMLECMCNNIGTRLPDPMYIGLLAIYLSSEVIDWCGQRLQLLKAQIEMLQQVSANLMKPQSKQDAEYKMLCRQSQLEFLVKLQDLLKLKRDINAVLASGGAGASEDSLDAKA